MTKQNKYGNNHWKTTALFKTYTYTCIYKLKKTSVLVYNHCTQKISRKKGLMSTANSWSHEIKMVPFMSKSTTFLDDILTIPK